ncbi:HypC/HybG/HupF family hydrogenase formation chaperone, partial [Candidatus Woesearchaeota archaeon]|nr:HypC/HybG/HupF family hydrogenase formation chaperone [Candidatus Woesearchaeota archaeon]
CLAMPGKIIKIKGDRATIQYPGQTREAAIIEGDYSVGDYVFVTSQIIVQKIPEEQALKSLKAWEEVEDAA